MKVNIGQQVRAGQALGTLTFHHLLAIEGHGFKTEVPLLERTAREGIPVEAEWLDQEPEGGKTYRPKLHIRTLANVTETRSQTVPFFIPLDNQYEEYERGG